MDDDKQDAWLAVGFLCAIMLLFLIVDLVQEDRLFSENENRVLAKRPALSWEALASGKFMEQYEDYVSDQFVGRDNWIELKTRSELFLRKKEINGVYLGKDRYLIEQHLPEDVDAKTVASKLRLLQGLVVKYGAKVMLVPTADNVLTDKLPAYAPFYDQDELLGQARSAVGEEAYIDVASALREHAQEEIYYRTDHHWTSLGAYYGYQAWLGHTGKLTNVKYDTQGMETVTQDFLGTLHSKINLPVAADEIRFFPETLDRPVKVTYDYNTETSSLYEDSYLEGKNKYGFFLDDNHGFVEVETGYQNGRELFVLKDSYANCFIPLLTPHYERIYVVDLRYYNGRLSQLMDPYMGASTDVLVLYNCIHFLEDFQYYG